MSQEETVSRIWLDMDRIKVCMMVTRDDEVLRARPMSGHYFRDSNEILFVADRTGAKDEEIEKLADVCLTFSDREKGIFISLSGEANIVEDRSRLKRIWSTTVDGWFENGPEDENAILLRVKPRQAEIWETVSNRMVAAAITLKAEDWEDGTDLGENKKVSM